MMARRTAAGVLSNRACVSISIIPLTPRRPFRFPEGGVAISSCGRGRPEGPSRTSRCTSSRRSGRPSSRGRGGEHVPVSSPGGRLPQVELFAGLRPFLDEPFGGRRPVLLVESASAVEPAHIERVVVLL